MSGGALGPALINGVILGLLWVGAAYRGLMAVRMGTRHRRLLAVAAIGLAAATTLFVLRDPLDRIVGVPNLSLLGMRVVGITAGAAGLLWLESRTVSSRRSRGVIFVTAAAIVLLVIAWGLSPIHDAQLTDIATLERGWPTVYGGVLYLYAGYVFAVVGWVALRHVRDIRHTDPAGAFSTGFIAAASVTALILIVLFLINLLIGRPWLHTLRTVLVPAPAVLMITGYVAIPLVAPLIQRLAAAKTIRRTRTLWSALVDRHPEVRLPLPATAKFSQPLLAQRRLIEISDSLEQHTIADARSMSELGAAILTKPVPEGESARSALLRLDPGPWPTPVLHLADAVSHSKEPPR